jgi:hypothetical protein
VRAIFPPVIAGNDIYIFDAARQIAPFVFVSTIVEYHQNPTIHMVSYRAQHHKV